jgi:hypothetical protein
MSASTAAIPSTTALETIEEQKERINKYFLGCRAVLQKVYEQLAIIQPSDPCDYLVKVSSSSSALSV